MKLSKTLTNLILKIKPLNKNEMEKNETTKAELVERLIADGIVTDSKGFEKLTEKQLLELIKTKEKRDDYNFDSVIEKLKEEGSETLANKLNSEIVRRRQAEQKAQNLKEGFKKISDNILELLK